MLENMYPLQHTASPTPPPEVINHKGTLRTCPSLPIPLALSAILMNFFQLGFWLIIKCGKKCQEGLMISSTAALKITYHINAC